MSTKDTSLEDWVSNKEFITDAENRGYAVVKINSLEQAMKLEAFIMADLYTTANEEKMYHIPF